MADILTSILFYGKIALEIIFAFGLVILIHELGHFLVAKLVGVGATDFALGMGPELFGFQWGETRCKLCLFPIGGYVKLIGEEDEEVPEEYRNKSLRSKKTWQKVTVIFAGPFMNFVLAIFLCIMVLFVWGEPRPLDINMESYMEQPHTVIAGFFVDPRKPAGRAGVKKGDTILKVDGKPVRDGRDLSGLINAGHGRAVALTLLRDYKTLTIKVKPKSVRIRNPKTQKMETRWQVGVVAWCPTPRQVDTVRHNSPAARAGIKKGDIILDFDRQDFISGNTYAAPTPRTDLLLYRDGKNPKHVRLDVPVGRDIGLALLPVNRRIGLGKSMVEGFRNTIAITKGFFLGIKGMINREVSADEIAGPVGIMQYAATFARSSFMDFISFFAAISVCLGVINLVPFPALDGSQILFFLWEGLTRRPLNPERQTLINYVGLCILLGLILLVTFRDIRLWIGF